MTDGVELYCRSRLVEREHEPVQVQPATRWHYNLDTKALGLVTNQCYRLDVYLDGVRISTQQFAIFKPTK